MPLIARRRSAQFEYNSMLSMVLQPLLASMPAVYIEVWQGRKPRQTSLDESERVLLSDACRIHMEL